MPRLDRTQKRPGSSQFDADVGSPNHTLALPAAAGQAEIGMQRPLWSNTPLINPLTNTLPRVALTA